MLTVLPLFFWVRSHADTFGAETAQKLRPRQLVHFQFRPTDDLRREVVNLAIVRTTLNRQLNNFKVSTGLTYLNGFHGEGSFRAGRTNGWRTAEVLMDERIARGMQNSQLPLSLAGQDSVSEGEGLLFFVRKRNRCLDQFGTPELVFILVGTSVGESLLGHPSVEKSIPDEHIPIPIEHSGEKVGIVVGTAHQALVFEPI